MDITLQFRACVKASRSRNLHFGTNEESEKGRNIVSPNKFSKSDFIVKAREVLRQITRLKNLILEHRKAYLNFASHLPDTPQMTDMERDKIDSGAQEIMSKCSHLIQDFKKESNIFKGPLQLLEHQKAVLELIETYLKIVCKLYSEQSVMRVKRSLEIQKLSKLEFNPKQMRDSPIARPVKQVNLEEMEKQTTTFQRRQQAVPELYEEPLSPEEMQMFEYENSQLFNEMNSLTEEVKQIESKVVHIAELQEIFTEKVLQQEVDIDRIATTVIGTTENVKDANEQIRQAIQRNAGLRVWVLFFLLIMSFSLLFLDWYND